MLTYGFLTLNQNKTNNNLASIDDIGIDALPFVPIAILGTHI
jgi:hypothetical protein